MRALAQRSIVIIAIGIIAGCVRVWLDMSACFASRGD